MSLNLTHAGGHVVHSDPLGQMDFYSTKSSNFPPCFMN